MPIELYIFLGGIAFVATAGGVVGGLTVALILKLRA